MSMRGDPADAVHARLAGQLQVMTPADPRSDEALALLARSPADDRALDDDDLRAGFGDMLEVAFRQGVVGLAQDIAGFMLQPWVIAKIIIAVAVVVTDVLIVVAVAHDAAVSGQAQPPLYGSTIAHVVVLAVATVLSVFKPWGRTPWVSRDRRADAG
jgi:hypothetical protein